MSYGRQQKIRNVPSLGTCCQTGKKMFTHRNAEKVARALRRSKRTNHHVYRCEACRYAHVGSNLARKKCLR